MRGSNRLLGATLLALWMTAAPLAAHAESPAKEFGMGAATVMANLVYGPVKLLYAMGGGLVASMAYAFSGGDVEVARPIVDASLRGDYFVTTGHLRGTEDLEFIGRRPGYRRMDDGGVPADDGGVPADDGWGAAGDAPETDDPGF